MDYSPIYSLLNKLSAFAGQKGKWLRARFKRHYRTKRNRRQSIYILGGFIILTLAFSLIGVSSQKQTLESTLNVRQAKLQQLKTQFKTLQSQKNSSDQQIKDRDQKLKDTQKQIDDLNKQLQAKNAAKSAISQVAAALSPATASAAPAAGCGDNSYANYIYSHESGCSTTIRNAEGCIGIGQACPASKLLAVCPNLDYACENGFFTAYANTAYGGWAGAYNFWLAHHWW